MLANYSIYRSNWRPGLCRRLSVALGAALLVLAGFSCQRAGRMIITMFTPEYKPEGIPDRPPVYEGPDASRPRLDVRLVPVAKGIQRVTDIQFLPGSNEAMLVLEKDGRLLLVSVKTGAQAVVATIPVLTESEQGLLGLAFHPAYRTNGLMYLNVVQRQGGADLTRIVEYHVANPANPAGGKLTQKRIILSVEQPFQNHNAGQLQFGPDGMLYVGLGDGGLADDRLGHGQNTSTLLGAMLRIAIGSGDRPYDIPSDNPFVGRPGFRPEIWAYGLRNPWRYSFDPQGRLIVADVGQNKWEEVSIVEKGRNYGWNVWEANHCFKDNELCKKARYTPAVFEYGREDGGSITGGYVATGPRAPSLRGKYLVGDFMSGRIWALDLPDKVDGTAKAYTLGKRGLLISTFGRDAEGNVYVGDYGGGVIYRLEE